MASSLSDGLGLTSAGFIGSLGSGLAEDLFSRFANPANLGGCDFYIIDSREQAGRRIQRQLFPNSDVESQVFQDFGNSDSPIHITGVICGDDYVARAKRMREILQSEGPKILTHPWWGRLRVRLLEPASISFHQNQIRVATFDAALVREELPIPEKGFFSKISNSLDHLLQSAGSLADSARGAVGEAFGMASIPLGMASAVRSGISNIKGVFDAVTGSAPESVKSAIITPQAQMAENIAPSVKNEDEIYSNHVSDVLNATPAAIGSCLPNQQTSIVAPAAGAQTSLSSETPDVSASAIGDILLNAMTQISHDGIENAQRSPSQSTALFISVIAQIFCSVQLMNAWSLLSFVSNQDCQTVFDKYCAALETVQSDIEHVANTDLNAPLSDLMSALLDMKNALSIDASNRIGRLPNVVRVSLPAKTSLFLLANAMAGDDQTKIVACFEDLVSRNAVSHPAAASGDLEALDGK